MGGSSTRASGLIQPVSERSRVTAFICGCGHSGTSLLANMFAAHPDVYVPLRETEIFLVPRDQAAVAFESLRQEAIAAGKPFLIEKTPRHIRHLDTIRGLVPTPRFIVPVRDGRDVAASMARRSPGQSAAPGIERWIRDNRIVSRERFSADVRVYRHEDLVTAPAFTLRTICEFVGIPFDPGMLDYHRTNRTWFGVEDSVSANGANLTHEELRNWQINQPIFNSAGRWRTELSEADLQPLTTGEGRSLMIEFGYL